MNELYVIRTDVNNELLSKNRRIIVFDSESLYHAKWFLSGVNFITRKLTFPNWKIEKYNGKYNSITCISAKEYFGEAAYNKILKDTK